MDKMDEQNKDYSRDSDVEMTLRRDNTTIKVSKSARVFKKDRDIPPAKAYIVIVGGNDRGTVMPVDQPKVTLGRGPECSIMLQDESVSRFHAEIIQTETGNAVLRDLGSTNGTFIGGEKVKEAVLKHGDRILLGGRSFMRYEVFDQLDAEYQNEIYTSSIRDRLTGIYNRRYFNQKIVTALSLSKSHAEWISLLIFNLDNFKQINETYGHSNGELVLTGITRSVSSILRPEDIFTRYDGEEFAIIVPGSNFEMVMSLGQRVQKRVESESIIPRESPAKAIKTTVSIGISVAGPEFAGEAGTVISAATHNLYEAKCGGWNKIVCSVLK